MSHSEAQDAYTRASDNTNKVSTQDKLDGLEVILKTTKFGMMTTRDIQGCLHSRAMALSSHEGLHFQFLTDCDSHKVDELDNDQHVNVSFLDPSTTNWVSVCGIARTHKNKEVISKLWNPLTKAWFSDLGDGIHKGDENDPRVAVIEIVPDEIRYWQAQKGKLAQTIDIATSALTGKISSAGELRTITKDEIQTVEALNIRAK